MQPSAVVRFAKHFGFSGYTELQKIFRDGISQQIAPSHNYQARIRDVIDHAQGRLSSADIASEFMGGAIAGMRELQRGVHDSALDDAVELLAHAPSIWVAGARRSFPAASYLTYALQHADRPIHLVTGVGVTPPETGASTAAMPGARSAAIACAAAGPDVDRSTNTLSAREVPINRAVSRASAGPGTLAMATVLAAAASPADFATLAPSAASGPVVAATGSYTVRSCPAAISRVAMADPMRPTPMKAIFSPTRASCTGSRFSLAAAAAARIEIDAHHVGKTGSRRRVSLRAPADRGRE